MDNSKIKQCNVQQLAELLSKAGCQQTIIDKLKEEEVDGPGFLEINENDMKELGLKLGHRKTIQRLQKQFSIYDSIVVVTTVSEAFVESNAAPVLYSSPSTSNATSNPEFEFEHETCSEIDVERHPPLWQTNFNIREAVETNRHGPKILKFLKDNGTLNDALRAEVTRIACNLLQNVSGYYPHSKEKDYLARCIVRDFPQLKSSRQHVEGHEHFYDMKSNAGYIEYRFKNMRLKLLPFERKNKKRTSTPTIAGLDALESDSDTKVSKKKKSISDFTQGAFESNSSYSDPQTEEMVQWMQYAPCNDETKDDIISKMKLTYNSRRRFLRDKSPSITDMIDKYPKITTFHGEIFDLEFELLFGAESAKRLTEMMPNFIKKIFFYCDKICPTTMENYAEEEDCVKAILLLIDLLPEGNVKYRGQKNNALRRSDLLFRQFPLGSNLYEELEAQGHDQKQLFLLREYYGGYFLALDNILMDTGFNLTRSLDLLFKSHFIFNVSYNPNLNNFFCFLETYFYDIKMSKIVSRVESLLTSLNNVKI